VADLKSESTLAEFRTGRRKNDGLQAHTSMGEYLMMYEGLVLYMKEMDEDRYQRLCSVSPLTDVKCERSDKSLRGRTTWRQSVNYISLR
jgi:hypothetical protein